MNSLFWQKLKSEGILPSPREGCAFHYLSNEKWILFGGTGDRRTNEVFIYEPQTGIWDLINPEGHIPRPRAYPASWVDEIRRIFFIHGGQGEKRDSLSDLFALDIDQFIWKKLYIIDQPAGRAHHAACKVQEKVYIYGGYSAGDNRFLEDLWSFHYVDIDWSASGTEVPAPGWVNHKTRGVNPGARKGHSLCSFEENVVLFGGVNKNKYFSDLFVLNTAEMRWVKTQPKGKGPSPRAYHSCTMMENENMAIFGGVESLKEGRADRLNVLNDFYVLNMTEMHWSCPVLGGVCPSRRFGHSMAFGFEEGCEKILLLGGLEQSYCPLEVFSLFKSEVSTGEAWKMVSIRKESTYKPADEHKKLKDLLAELAINKDRIVILENEKQSLTERLEEEERKAVEDENDWNARIMEMEESYKLKTQELAAVNRQIDNKGVQFESMNRKIEALEDLVKKAESLLITLDHSLTETISMNLHSNFKGLSKERIEEITERKKKHHETLLKVRSMYENGVAEEEEDDEESIVREKSSISSPDSLRDSLEEESI